MHNFGIGFNFANVFLSNYILAVFNDEMTKVVINDRLLRLTT